MTKWLNVAVMSLATGLYVGIAQAQQSEWIDPFGGSFNDAQNWNPAIVPGSQDSILFDLPASYVVTGDFAYVSATTVRRSDVGVLFTYSNKGRFGGGGNISFGSLEIGGIDLDRPGSLALRGRTFGDAGFTSIGSGTVASRLIFDPMTSLYATGPVSLRDAASIEFNLSVDTPRGFYSNLLFVSDSGNKFDGSLVVGVPEDATPPILGTQVQLLEVLGSFELDDFPFQVVRPPAGRTFELGLRTAQGVEAITAKFVAADTVASIALSQSDDLDASPTRLVTADLDSDGSDDLVVLVESGLVKVYRSLGDGTFESPTEYAVCGSPIDASSGDFDGDGTADLAVGCASDSTLLFLFNPDDDPSLLVEGPSTTVDGEIRSLAATSFPTTNLARARGISITMRSLGGRGRTKGYIAEGTNVIEIADVEVGDEPGPSDPVEDEGKKDPEEPIGVGGVQRTGFGTVNPILTLLRPVLEAPGFEVASVFPLSGVAVDFASGDLDGDLQAEILVVTKNGHLDLLRSTRPDIPVRAVHLGGTPTSIAVGEIVGGGGPEIVIGLADPARVEIYRAVPDFMVNVNRGTSSRIVLERYAVQILGDAPSDLAVTTVQNAIDDSEVIIGLPGGGSSPSVNVTEVEVDPAPECTFSDFNGDGKIDSFDLAFILGYWGPCLDPNEPCATFDLNDDGQVDAADLGLLFSEWGLCE